MPHKNELTLTAFIAKFNSEKACHEYLVKKRWPNGFVYYPAKERTVGYSRMENMNVVIAISKSV